MFQNQRSITKTRTSFCSPCYLLWENVKNKYLKNIICEYKCSKKVKKVASESALPQYVPNPKSKFQVKFIFT